MGMIKRDMPVLRSSSGRACSIRASACRVGQSRGMVNRFLTGGLRMWRDALCLRGARVSRRVRASEGGEMSKREEVGIGEEASRGARGK